MGSAVYHDCIWYPIVGKKKIKEFMKTEWGELFEKY
jgi:23S rRNA A2030 N6-methylase RlmJ